MGWDLSSRRQVSKVTCWPGTAEVSASLLGKTAVQSSLRVFLQPGILLDQLLLAVPREADGEFGGRPCPLAAEDQSSTVFGMSDVGAGHEILGGSADIWIKGGVRTLVYG